MLNRLLIVLISLLVVSLIFAGGMFYYDNYYFIDHNEYNITLGAHQMTWGSFMFNSHIPSEPKVRVEYLLPKNFAPQTASMVFYAPYGNAKNALERAQLYAFAAEHNMLIYTIQFNYKIQRSLPANQNRVSVESGWYEKIFSLQKRLESHFDIPHKKLFIFGDSAGAAMSMNASHHYPELVEAAAWLSAGGRKTYQDINHPYVLAMSTWGDPGTKATKEMIQADQEQGGYSMFMVTPPSWPEKGYSCFHHGAHDIGYTLIKEFFAGIADKRNSGKAWSDTIEANGRTMSSPSEKFSQLWSSYPHAIVDDVVAKEQNDYDGLIYFPVEESKSVVFYIQDYLWARELWLIDNLFFIAENRKYGVATLPNVDIDKSLAELFSDENLADKDIEIIVGGELASKVDEAIDRLSDKQLQRISRIVYLNPPIDDVSTLLNSPKVEVWSSAVSFKDSENPQIFYRSEDGISFGHFYYKVFADVLKR